jgi:glucose/arabinose dehydrogenase/PKD repeat protein
VTTHRPSLLPARGCLLPARRGPAAGRDRVLSVTLSVALVLGSLAALVAATAPAARAATLPGFQESVVFSGLTNPTVVRFAPDGRVFVAEKRGVIKVFDSLTDTTPTTFADLNVNVYNFWDRGLLGMALAPNFPADPYVYILYSYDHELGSAAPAPRWGTAGVYSDPCPTPPGPSGSGGCVVSGRLSRLQANGNTMSGAEQVLVEDWCQQYPSHSIGTVEFGADGSLYASGGDGASFEYVDYGQTGSPLNPCGDPPGGVGTTLTAPTAEGGALRSQDLRTPSDPVSLDGTLIRINPATGAGLPNNPLASSPDPNARRIIANGLRNPFRFTTRPGTTELWLGDVGWSDWEEINRITDPLGTVENFGWPCYEGPGRQGHYDFVDLNICENLYGQAGAVTAPYHAYRHADKVVANETCPEGSSSIAGLQFEFAGGGDYPTEYQDALFFADYSRDCIWAMLKGTNGLPAPGLIRTFAAGAANPVNLETGPDGDLFYVDFDGGTIRRISYTAGASCPIGQYNASYFANQTLSGTPVTERCESAINYDWGSGSPSGSGVGPDNFSVRWAGTHSFATTGTYTFTATADDGVRVYLDGTLVIDQWKDQSATTYTASRTVTAGDHELKVEYYENGGDAVARFSVTGANGAPTAVATASPTTGSAPLTVSFNGSGSSDPEGTPLSFAWDLDGDAAFDDASTAQTSYTYTANGVYTASLRVTDSQGASDTDSVTITVGNTPPTATINTPAAGTTWKVGDTISFSGSATDLEDGPLPASRLSWRLIQQHCPSNCHSHLVQTWDGVTSGSFVAPSHEYPSYLELELTATDSDGLTHTVTRRLDPRTVVLTFQTTPGGLQLAVNGTTATASFTRTVIVGSTNGITAPSPQTKAGKSYNFQSWSDGGARSHTIVAPATATTYTARFSFK